MWWVIKWMLKNIMMTNFIHPEDVMRMNLGDFFILFFTSYFMFT